MTQVDAFMADCSDSGKKSPLVANSTISKMQSMRNPDRRMSTLSTVLYAARLMTSNGYNDELDLGEWSMDQLLEQHQTGLATAVDTVKKNSPDIPNIEDSNRSQTKLFLPERMLEELPDRGFGEIVDTAIIEYCVSPYSSRLDRIKAKYDLLQYLRHDTEPEHRVIKELLEHKSESEKYNFGSLLTIFNEANYWSEYDSVSKILMSDDWESINTGSPRIEAMEEYYQRVAEKAQNNSIESVEQLPTTFNDVYSDIGTAYSPSRPTKRDHARQIDIAELTSLIKEKALTESEQETVLDIQQEVLYKNNTFEIYEAQNSDHVLVTKTDVMEFIFEKSGMDITLETETVERTRRDGGSSRTTKYSVTQN